MSNLEANSVRNNYTDDELLHILTEILRQECQVTRAISKETKLLDDLELDSVALLTMVLATENYFQMALEEDEDEIPQVLGDLITLLQVRLRARAEKAVK